MGSCCSKKSSTNSGDGVDLRAGIDNKKKICIWVLGGPGSGKGTQCKILADKFKLVHLSTGDLLRKVSQEDSPLANQIRQTMERGGLVDTPTVLQLLIDAMNEAYPKCNGFLIDGYPREVDQGVQFCEKIGTPHLIFYMDCPDEILIARLLKRGQDSGRVDDNEETIQLRLQTFHNISKPVMEHWKDLVISIDTDRSKEEVGQKCVEVVQTFEPAFHFKYD